MAKIEENKRLGIGKYPNKVIFEVTPELSKEIQEYVYANGGEAGNGDKDVHNTDVKYLGISNGGRVVFALDELNKDRTLDPEYGFTEIKVNSLQDFISYEAQQGPVTPKSLKSIFWKNPKPTRKNAEPLFPSTHALVDGLAIPAYISQVVTKDGKSFAEIDGKLYEQSTVFPIYQLKDGVAPAVGDIAFAKGEYNVIKNKNDLKNYNTGSVLFRITPNAADCVAKREYEEFSDGKIIDKTTGEVVDNVPETAITVVTKINQPYEVKAIAEHFGVKVKDVRPKDEIIFKTLVETLDHPINVEAREWAMLVGPSGSGKTEIAIKYANHKNLDYLILQGTAQLTKDDIIGYHSITTGEYFPSLLRDAVENGKVLIIDEIDACNPNTVLVLNSLKSDYYQFPDKLVKVHKDFRLIATANTLGQYSDEYNGRQPLDKATIKRFQIIEYTLEKHEMALRFGFENVKDILTKQTQLETFNRSSYKLNEDFTLTPTDYLDPRDLQRIARQSQIKKAKK